MSNDRQIIEQLLDRWESAWDQGIDLPESELCSSNPQLQQELAQKIKVLKGTDWMVQPAVATELPPLPDFDQLVIDIPIPSSLTLRDFVSKIAASGVLDAEELSRIEATDASDLAKKLIGRARLTRFQLKKIVSDEAPQLVLGNYVILDRIGAGGMGEVYKARHQRMDRMVALKILPREAVKSLSAIERFQREVKAAAKLEHPNIVTAYDAGESNGTHFLVMQLVDGQDLSYYVQQNGRMTGGKAINCILQAARGLAYAHQKGVVHRDIKPSNLFLDREGTVKILDMGLARFASAGGDGSDPTIAKLTIDGTVIGTVDYMSPEQAIDAASVDARSDIYSLGCALYFLLTGKSVYGGSYLMAKMLAHREAPIPSLENEEINAAFQRMVAKKPEGRFQTAQQLISELELLEDKFLGDQDASTIELPRTDDPSFVETSSIGHAKTIELQLSKPESQPVLAKPFVLSRRWYAGGIAVALLALGAFGAAYLYDIIFKIETPDGIVQIESSHPDLEVFVDGQKVIYITDSNDNTKIKVEVPKGAKTLRVSKGGFEASVSEFKLESVKGAIKVTFIPRENPAEPFDESVRAKLAKRVLETGGKLTIKVEPRNEFAVDSVGNLPNEAFTIQSLIYRADSVDVALMEMISRVSELRELDLEAQGITDAHMKYLASLSNLEQLNIQHNGITDVGLENLGELIRLKSLNLTGTGITQHGLAKLHKLENLTYLTVRNTNISIDDVDVFLTFGLLERLYLPQVATNEWLDELSVIKSLRYLNVEGASKITADGVAKFRQVLPECEVDMDSAHRVEVAAEQKRVSKWVLSVGGRVYLDGSGGDTVTTPIEIDQRVTDKPLYFFLAETGIRDEDLKEFAEIPAINVLVLSGNPIDGSGLMYLIDKGPICLHLDSTNVNDAAMNAIAKIADGSPLVYMSNTKITDIGLKEFYSLPTFLDLDSTAITDRGVAILAKIKNRTQILDLSNTSITDVCVDDLIRFTSLTSLWIFDTAITEKGIAKLHAGLPKCNIRDNDRKAAEWFLSAGGRISLKSSDGEASVSLPEQLPSQPFAICNVDLSKTNVEDAGLENLARLRHLSHVNLSSTHIGDPGLKRLSGLKLRVLILADCVNVTNDGVAKLREALPDCQVEWHDPHNETVVAEQKRVANWILSVGGRVFLNDDEMTSPSDIEKLVTEMPLYFYLASTGIQDEDLKQFADLTAITRLCLDQNPKIDGSGLNYLLGKGSIELLLDSTGVNDAAMNAIASISDGASVLELSNTKITDVGLKELKRLNVNLYLNGTSITDVGVATLAKSNHKGIQTLLIFNTKITDACIGDLSTLASLKRLDLNGTAISDEGLARLKAALPNCQISRDTPK